MAVPLLDSLQLTELATPGSNPASGNVFIYAKSDGNLYILNSAGVEVLASASLLLTAGFISAVETLTPNQLATMTGNLPGGGNRGTGWANGVAASDLATIAQTSGVWILDTNTWTHVANTNWQLKATGVDVTAIYTKGAKFTWKESGVTKYGVIASSSFSTDTTVNLVPTIDYVVAASPDTGSVAYSYSNPQGFPSRFMGIGNLSVTLTTTAGSAAATLGAANANILVGMEVAGNTHIPAGVTVAAYTPGSTSLTLSTGTSVTAGTSIASTISPHIGYSTAPTLSFTPPWWSIQNGICEVDSEYFGAGVSNSTATGYLLPIPGLDAPPSGGHTFVLSLVSGADNSVSQFLEAHYNSSSSTSLLAFSKAGNAAMTVSGNKAVMVHFRYPI